LLGNSNNNLLSSNIASNTNYGIELSGSSDNVLVSNTASNNRWSGISLWNSNSNVIYHNNFVDNIGWQAYLPTYPKSYNNTWDDGYPYGGNYWSDYTGVDVKRGPNQDFHGSDGIGDTPYIIDANNTDHYPLMNPYGAPPLPTYSLTITTTVGGTTNPAPGTYSYTANSAVQVTAIPNSNYLFHHWELDSINVGSANPYTVLMDTNHLLKAVFSPISPPKPPVGGYSVTIEGYTPAQPLTSYIALAAFLMTAFTIARRKTHKRTK